ncbi:MAG: hormogonium polysaccharide biosynthesis acetyltransferase HpsU [Phormidium sp.]
MTQWAPEPADPISASKKDPLLDAEPWMDLRQYDQSNFDRGRSGWVILLWWLVQAIAFPLTPHQLHAPRNALLRLFGAKIGKGVVIRPTARFTYPWKVEIGDYSWIGDDVVLYSLDYIRIGSHSVISQECYLCTGSHNFEDSAFSLVTAPITIGNGVWVATDSLVGPGVEIGANTIVGARSSVFRTLPAGQVCWGSPCRPHHPRTMKKLR